MPWMYRGWDGVTHWAVNDCYTWCWLDVNKLKHKILPLHVESATCLVCMFIRLNLLVSKTMFL